MGKVLLNSILLASIVVPLHFGRAVDARRGLRALVTCLVLFDVFYLIAIVYVVPRLF